MYQRKDRALKHPAGAKGGGVPSPRQGGCPSTNPPLVSKAENCLAARSSRLFVKKLVIVSVVWHPEALTRPTAVETSWAPARTEGWPPRFPLFFSFCFFFDILASCRVFSQLMIKSRFGRLLHRYWQFNLFSAISHSHRKRRKKKKRTISQHDHRMEKNKQPACRAE